MRLLLSFRLGLDSSAFEDNKIAYRLSKRTVLPADWDRFLKIREEAILCSSSLVRRAYEVFSLLS